MQRILLLSVLALIAACEAAPEAEAIDNDLVEIVTIDADGSSFTEVSRVRVSRETQRLINEHADFQIPSQLGERAVYTVPCPGTSLRLYDQENFAGNQVCFLTPMTTTLVNLATINRVCPIGSHSCTHWDNAVRSYQAQTVSGFLDGSHGSQRYCKMDSIADASVKAEFATSTSIYPPAANACIPK